VRFLKQWPHIELGAVCTKIGSGATPRGGATVYVDDGPALIRSQNVYNGLFTADGLVHLKDEHAEQLRGVTVESGDVLLNITGDSVARCCQVPDWVLPARVNQHVAIVRPDPDQLLPEFLSYYFVSPLMQKYLLSRAGSGGTRNALPKRMIETFEVPCPDVHLQQGIVDLLRNYDHLIENNRRRIQLLEQAARLLYKEWFIHLRFPGHEHVTITDGVPEGWERTTVVQVCTSFDDGDWIESKDQGGEDFRLLQISNIGDNDFVETGNPRYITAETFRNLRCNEVISGDILISRMPKPIGRAWYVYEQPWRMITAVDVTIARPNPAIIDPFYYLYHLNSPTHLARCEVRATGATRPRVSRRNMGALPLLKPPMSLQRNFGETASSINAQRNALTRQNERLTQARDLLLPRLMNGELVV